MNMYTQELDKARAILGSYKAIGKVCGGISGKAVMKWRAKGRPPRTEYSGETNYAEMIALATDRQVEQSRLKPELRSSVTLFSDEQQTNAEALQKAVDLMGGQTALARAIGGRCRQGHVWKWLNRGKTLPAERAVQIERATSGRVKRHELRPDLFDDPQQNHPNAA